MLDWVRMLTPDEKKVLAWALADQDALIRRQGESAYYANVTQDTGEVVMYESLREELIEGLT